MAIKPCRECGKEISTEAKACPRCGAAARKNVPGWLVAVTFIAIGLGAWAKIHSDAATGAPKTPTPSTAAQPAPAAESTPAPDDSPNYAINKGRGVYGYEQGISDTDRANGVQSKPLLMIRFLGRQGDRIKFESIPVAQGDEALVFTCSMPCEYVDITDRAGSSQTMRAAPASVLGLIIDDIASGRLSTGADDPG
jgi:hypothetical protein